jgi:ATP synthase protein I
MAAGGEPERDRRRDFLSLITGKRRRREEHERQGERSFWSGVAMLGLVGWLVVIPTLIGIFLGRWLDSRLGSGVFWTLTLMMIGLAAGCYNAWRAIHER